MVWVGIIWSIWLYRNNIIFRNHVSDAEKVFVVSQMKMQAWINNRIDKVKFNYFDWCLNPILCIKFVY